MSKWNYIFGTITIVAIVGGVIYAIKKSKELEAEENHEEAMTVEDAMAEVRARKEQEQKVTNNEDDKRTGGILADSEKSSDSGYVRSGKISAHLADDYAFEDGELDEEEMENLKEEASWNSSFIISPEDRTYNKEDIKLQYEPNSENARKQFIQMELAEWNSNEDTYHTLRNLFEFPFEPENDGDHILKTTLIDYRVGFFGFESRWVKDISYAEVILHYAKAADYNCGDGIRNWVEYFFEFNELHHDYPIEKLQDTIIRLNNHVYFNEGTDTFGLFGLTNHHMNGALKVASRNVDNNVTYEIEFNEFLKSCL